MEDANERNQDRYVRWQRTTGEHLSFVNNLFLIFSVGLFTFLYAFIDQSEKFSYSIKLAFAFSVVFNSLSFLAGVFCALNRLKDFRLTANIAKGVLDRVDKSTLDNQRDQSRELGEITWDLLYTQVYLMLISWGLIVLLVCLDNINKF